MIAPKNLVNKEPNLLVSSQYMINRKIWKNNKIRYNWSFSKKLCSFNCSHDNFKRKILNCKDLFTGKIVPKIKCNFIPKPKEEIGSCHNKKYIFKKYYLLYKNFIFPKSFLFYTADVITFGFLDPGKNVMQHAVIQEYKQGNFIAFHHF